MRRGIALTVLLTVLVASFAVPGTGIASGAGGNGTVVRDAERPQPSIEAVYPNPVAKHDAGEFIVISVPPGVNLTTYSLADEQTTVPLPNVTERGRVTFSTNATAARVVLDRQVHPLPDSLTLANSGERVTLRRDGRTVDALSYDDAPEGDVLVWENGGNRWRPLGSTDRPVVTAGGGTARAFVLPDGSQTATQFFSTADDRILLAGYTITSREVADALVAAARRDVRVEVLVEESPVGGMVRRQAVLLDHLQRAGIEVSVLGGDRSRFAFHHAKYAVVDERALVTTENWKPSGVGGHSSRGWGIIANQSAISEGLASTFHADRMAIDARPWPEVRAGRSFSPAREPPANESFASQFSPEVTRVESVRLLVAPDNAEVELISVLRNATRSVDVQQVSLGGHNHPLVCATLDAARRGVQVRVLLSSAWYVREDNQRLVDWLNERARKRNLPLEARLVDPRGRFEKVHTKGVVVDGDQVVLGSLNWNNNSVRNNREVVLLLGGEEVAGYYERIFEADWTGGVWSLTTGLLAILALALACGVARARRIEFDG